MFFIDPNYLKLVAQLKTLPSITQRVAEKIAFHLIKLESLKFNDFIDCLQISKDQLNFCSSCNLLTKKYVLLCDQCQDKNISCEELIIFQNQIDYIKMNQLITPKQSFFILNLSTLSTQQSLNAQLPIQQLLNFCQTYPNIKSIILAFNPNLIGKKLIKFSSDLFYNYNPKIICYTLGLGLPHNSEINYADQESLIHSLKNKQLFESSDE